MSPVMTCISLHCGRKPTHAPVCCLVFHRLVYITASRLTCDTFLCNWHLGCGLTLAICGVFALSFVCSMPHNKHLLQLQCYSGLWQSRSKQKLKNNDVASLTTNWLTWIATLLCCRALVHGAWPAQHKQGPKGWFRPSFRPTTHMRHYRGRCNTCWAATRSGRPWQTDPWLLTLAIRTMNVTSLEGARV